MLVRVSRPRSTRQFSGLFFAPAGHRLNAFLRRRAPADLQATEETRGSDMVTEGMIEVHTAHATSTLVMETSKALK